MVEEDPTTSLFLCIYNHFPVPEETVRYWKMIAIFRNRNRRISGLIWTHNFLFLTGIMCHDSILGQVSGPCRVVLFSLIRKIKNKKTNSWLVLLHSTGAGYKKWPFTIVVRGFTYYLTAKCLKINGLTFHYRRIVLHNPKSTPFPGRLGPSVLSCVPKTNK